MNFNKFAIKTVASALIVCNLTVWYTPALAAVNDQLDASKVRSLANAPSSAERLNQLVQALQLQKSLTPATSNRLLGYVQRVFNVGGQAKHETLEGGATPAIVAEQTKLKAEQAKQLDDMAATRAFLLKQKLPASVVAEHDKAVAALKTAHAQLNADMAALAKAQQQQDYGDRQQALTNLQAKLGKWSGNTQPINDWNNLADQAKDPSKVPKPLSPEDIKKKKMQYSMDNGRVIIDPRSMSSLVQPPTVNDSQPLLAQQGIKYGNNPSDQYQLRQAEVTAPEWPVLAQMPETVQPQDTLANEDVQLTDDIKALAASLNNNPAQIYKWVYDNVLYSPTFGSVQGAQLTWEHKRGNAFDTSSLLIALLRAAGIPARYVYGSIDVPANVATNWVGGVNNAEAAQQVLGQGGVPNLAFQRAGVTQFIRMEHVWVEAYMPYFASRGAHMGGINRSNPVWLPMDASYKIVERTKGIDLAAAVPFDAQAFINSVTAGAAIDEATGSVQNLDQAKVKAALEDYQAKVKTYIDTNKPNATVGDVLGTSKIRPYPSRMLAPNLPYKVAAVVSDYHTLPDTLRHYFTVRLYDSPYQQALGDVPQFSVRIPTPRMQGKPLAFTFKPAGKADEDTIASYLPKPHADGSPIQPSELPSTLPGYLINVTPELSLDGQNLLTSNSSYKLGQEITLTLGYESPNNTQFAPKQKIVRGGEYIAIGYSLEGITQAQLERTKAQLEAAKLKLEDGSDAQLATLTKHDLTGAMLQAGVQSYFALNQTEDYIAGLQADAYDRPFMSYGSFSTYLQPNTSYGIVGSVKIAGMLMDIDQIARIVTNNSNITANTISYKLTRGPVHSANEHLVPEMLFDNPNTPAKEAEGVSAVKALQVAAQQGQKIFTITQANSATALPQLSHKAVIMQDVRDALAAGKTVTISQRSVTVANWTGTGYIITNPNTGSGSYLIGGGADGGFLTENQLGSLTGLAQGMALAGMFGALLPLFAAGALGIFIAVWLIISLIIPIMYLMFTVDNVFSDEAQNCRESWVGFSMGLFGAIFGFKGGDNAAGVVAFLFGLFGTTKANSSLIECAK